MLASDGIYSTEWLPLDYGTGLGQWEPAERPDIFVVQPGLYWSSGFAPKTRGIPQSAVIARAGEFTAAWENWIAAGGVGRPPTIPVAAPLFIGFGMALGLGDLGQAGRWRPQVNRISFAWNTKRAGVFDFADGGIHTRSMRGAYGLRSEPYNPADLTEFQQRQIEDEAMPDFVPWGNSGE